MSVAYAHSSALRVKLTVRKTGRRREFPTSISLETARQWIPAEIGFIRRFPG